MRLGRILRRGGSALLTSSLLAALLVVAGVQHQAAQPPAGPPTVEPATTHAAGSTYLCTGYAGCRRAGYGNAGYAAVNDRMYWRMYPGHNCTNYAAYRMIKAGMPNVRPWSGGGNASEWGLEMSSITDHRPTVGSIAWWGRYQNGHGSAGHVAYVERVVSPTEIIISEDAWGGDFHWRRITKDSGRWPGGFIHFVDKRIENRKAPAIAGTPRVGERLKAKRGQWTKQKRLTYGFQWYAGKDPIPGATNQFFTPKAQHQGRRLTVEVTGRLKGHEPGTARSAPQRIARGLFDVVEPTTFSGEMFVGEELTAAPATWSPEPKVTVHRWYADGRLVEGADGPTLTLTPALIGKQIQATTAARRPGYKNRPVRSDPVGPVLRGRVTVKQPFTVTGQPRVGEQLSASPGVSAPRDAAVGYQWLRDGSPIAGATEATYAVTGEDLGARLSLRLRLTKPDYATKVSTLAVQGTVTTRAEVRIKPVGKSRRAAVKVWVTAPGADRVTGWVRVRVGAKQTRVWYPGEPVRVVIKPLHAGKRTARARYVGRGPILWGRTDIVPVRITR